MRAGKILLALFLPLFLVHTALAGPSDAAVNYPGTVLELFTSQGCSSCPRANKFTRDLAATDDNILTLSYSVDYWDYLGWKDTFGKPEFSARQRAYGQQFMGQVYTPQLVINGAKHKSRYTKRQVRSQTLPVSQNNIQISPNGDRLDLRVGGKDFPSGTEIMLVTYKVGEQAVPVKRGENHGRTIKLVNVVKNCKPLSGWTKSKGLTAQLDMPAQGEAFAVLVQASHGGPILSAATYTP